MAILGLTASADVLLGLPSVDFALTIVASTSKDNGDGTWRITVETDEANIAALQALGITVNTVVSDAEQLARWQALDDQIDRGPGVA